MSFRGSPGLGVRPKEVVTSDLAKEGGEIKIDALIGDQLAIECENGDGRHSKGLFGGFSIQQGPKVGPQQNELGDDGVVIRHVHRDILVSLVRERLALSSVIVENGFLAHMDLSRWHDLVAGLTSKGRDGAVKLSIDLRREVLRNRSRRIWRSSEEIIALSFRRAARQGDD
jgi:hypothetical protein